MISLQIFDFSNILKTYLESLDISPIILDTFPNTASSSSYGLVKKLCTEM